MTTAHCDFSFICALKIHLHTYFWLSAPLYLRTLWRYANAVIIIIIIIILDININYLLSTIQYGNDHNDETAMTTIQYHYNQ